MDSAVDYIGRTSFHNLEKVNELYGKIFKFGIYKPGTEAHKFLIDATLRRHDCVHRNGRNKEGYLIAINHDYITNFQVHIDELVNYIQIKLSNEIRFINLQKELKDFGENLDD